MANKKDSQQTLGNDFARLGKAFDDFFVSKGGAVGFWILLAIVLCFIGYWMLAGFIGIGVVFYVCFPRESAGGDDDK